MCCPIYESSDEGASPEEVIALPSYYSEEGQHLKGE
jgi:hypothetical protein